MSDAYVPMPETSHPHYSEQAEAIRAYLHLPIVMVREAAQLSASLLEFGSTAPLMDTGRTRTLTVKRVAGPAPYVGDPRFDHRAYVWRVAVDDLGRHVAGVAELTDRSCRFE